MVTILNFLVIQFFKALFANYFIQIYLNTPLFHFLFFLSKILMR
jgi:hypothetical protein